VVVVDSLGSGFLSILDDRGAGLIWNSIATANRDNNFAAGTIKYELDEDGRNTSKSTRSFRDFSLF